MTLAGRSTAWHPPRALLELVELVLLGVLEALPTGTAWPALPPEQAAAAGDPEGLTLHDAEGTPVAVLAGERLRPGRPFCHGPLRSRRLDPRQVRAELAALGDGPVLAVPVHAALGAAQVDAVAEQARAQGARLLWLALVGSGRRADLRPEGLLRAVRDACADVTGRGIPGMTVPVAVPMPDLADSTGPDRDLLQAVARGFGADGLLTLPDRRGGALHPASARELDRDRPPPSTRGVTVFFTGLSGSGKSTIARGLAERLLEDGRRSVSLLDGDEVRRLLSHGLGFSRADRDLNIRRIGFVAAEITRHGGVAVCAPIAPFDGVRREVRERVEEGGDFVLVHVSTPLAECERRDRKGLYGRARRGEIPDFTGISSPYQEPADAQLRIDTTGMPVESAIDRVWTLLERRGYLGDGTDWD